ncbi:tail protein X [Herbaspirillum sp. BH-1]|jgi:phage tail protein X|uniref:Phage-related tail protein n=1 Tax=Herbaspirillum frisingense GSF30 TaxID=864073 RepID=A0AAI9IDF1_9BURK|nr:MULTISPECIES: tail protein X [Herbaspirillum]EOA03955.1 phage-related tail protein [Herbaspirillum frisingense GSF30]PLY58452.1 tail protein X [Herbaspirillum sp. BH-1]UIN20816.1 tail protein X [Herbaspirillum frisingense]
MQVRSQQGDTLDALVFRYLGASSGYVEQALTLNPSLAALGAVLPAGTMVTLPDAMEAPTSARDSISLWE